MSASHSRPDELFKVVMNHEEQYSIWFADRPNPLGWVDAGKAGLREECLDFIEKVWTDMRPLSVRKMKHIAPAAAGDPSS